PDGRTAGEIDQDWAGHAGRTQVDVRHGSGESGGDHVVGEGVVAVQEERRRSGRGGHHGRGLLRAVERRHVVAAAVVALLAADGVDEAVAAGLVRPTGRAAAVPGRGVAVVAHLAREVFDDAVAARERLVGAGGRAAVVARGVAVVALLGALREPVAA